MQLNVPFKFPFEILKKNVTQTGDWIMEGVATTDDLDLVGDIISKEAIENSVKDLIGNSTALLNHDEDKPIGKVLETKIIKDGEAAALWIKVLISKSVPKIWQQIKEGVLNKFSIRGKVLDAKKEFIEKYKKIVNVIKRMKLLEVSVVSLPANPQARSFGCYVAKAFEDYEINKGGNIEMLKDIHVAWLKVCKEKDFTSETDEKTINKAWEEFCKQEEAAANSSPYPQVAVHIGQVINMVEKLMSGKKEGDTWTAQDIKTLGDIKTRLSTLRLKDDSNYPAPAKNKEKEEEEEEENKGESEEKMMQRLWDHVKEFFGFGGSESDTESVKSNIKSEEESMDFETLKKDLTEGISEKIDSINASIEKNQEATERELKEIKENQLTEEKVKNIVGEEITSLSDRVKELEKASGKSKQEKEEEEEEEEESKSVFKGAFFGRG